MREIEFRAYLSEDQFKRLRQSKPSAGLVSGILALTLAWIFSGISLGPPTLQFGELQVGSGSNLKPVRLTNHGVTEFHAAIGVEGDSQDFQMDAQHCATVAPGESCVVWVEFRPREPGIKMARLTLRTRDGQQFSSSFTGRATKGIAARPPVPPPTPTPTPPVQPLSPANPSAPVAPPAPSPAPPNPPPPIVSEPSVPPVVPSPPIFIPPYKPASGVNQEPPPVPQIQIQPRAMDFSRPPGSRQLTVVNPGSAPLHIRFNLGGTDQTNFGYDPRACGMVLAASAQCTLTVTYMPDVDGTQKEVLSAWLGISHDATNAATPQTVSLRWQRTGPPPRLHVLATPGTLSFGGPPLGAEFYTAPPQTVTIRNDGTIDLRRLSLRLGQPGVPFTLSNNCPTSLARGQICSAQVRFAPSDSRQYFGSLNGFEGGLQLASVSLQGGGSRPAGPKPQLHLSMTPAIVRFSNSSPATEFSARQTITVRNDGTVGLKLLNLQLGPPGVPFTLTHNCPASLAPGQTCTAQVTFARRDSRQYAGALNGAEGGLQLARVDLQANGGSQQPPVKTPGKGISRLSGLGNIGSGTRQPQAPPFGGMAKSGSRQPSLPTPSDSLRNGVNRTTPPPAKHATNKISRAPTPPAPTRNVPSQTPVKKVPPPPAPVR